MMGEAWIYEIILFVTQNVSVNRVFPCRRSNLSQNYKNDGGRKNQAKTRGLQQKHTDIRRKISRNFCSYIFVNSFF